MNETGRADLTGCGSLVFYRARQPWQGRGRRQCQERGASSEGPCRWPTAWPECDGASGANRRGRQCHAVPATVQYGRPHGTHPTLPRSRAVHALTPSGSCSARGEMTALHKVETNCTAPSLIPTVNGNMVRSFSTHGQQSAAQGISTTVSRSDIRLIHHLDSSAHGWSGG
jgi:hypothetical protein